MTNISAKSGEISPETTKGLTTALGFEFEVLTTEETVTDVLEVPTDLPEFRSYYGVLPEFDIHAVVLTL